MIRLPFGLSAAVFPANDGRTRGTTHASRS